MLVALPGRLMPAPTLSIPPLLSVLEDPGEPIPRRDGGAVVDGRVWDDIGEPGRYALLDRPVPGLKPVAGFSLPNSSPSSEPISVMRDEIMLAVSALPAGKGFGNDALAGDLGAVEDAGSAMVKDQCYLVFAFWRLSLWSPNMCHDGRSFLEKGGGDRTRIILLSSA